MRKFGLDKAPDDFSLRLMKRMSAQSHETDKQTGRVVIQEDTLIGRRGKWFMLFICLALIAYGYSLGDGGGTSYLDQVAVYFSELTLPSMSLSLNFGSPVWFMVTLAVTGTCLLILADKMMFRLFGSLRL